jgi:hypothetical protein
VTRYDEDGQSDVPEDWDALRLDSGGVWRTVMAGLEKCLTGLHFARCRKREQQEFRRIVGRLELEDIEWSEHQTRRGEQWESGLRIGQWESG